MASPPPGIALFRPSISSPRRHPERPSTAASGIYENPKPLRAFATDPPDEILSTSHPRQYSLDKRSELLFSTEHLKTIFDDPSLLHRFTSFLSQSRPSAVPILVYYLDAVKALKALGYSNGIAESLEPIRGFDFTLTTSAPSTNPDLEEKAQLAFDALVREDLPAYITHTYIQTVSLSIQRRITGTLPAHLQEASEGLCEVFCLTDPSRPDNPIVFASEEFNKTTQYGMGYIIGRNCRFLQGPKTNQYSVRRIRENVERGVEHCEVFLNYRRDGSPFMNLLMTSPLKDSRGVIRYFIGAQVDVSGLVKECSDMESLKRLVIKTNAKGEDAAEPEEAAALVDEFTELTKMLNNQELDTVRQWGGKMHKGSQEEVSGHSNIKDGNWNKPRLLINSTSPDGFRDAARGSGKLSGIFENYLLVRPYPSLRILFASPSLRVPGILQSPFMNKIGGSQRVRDELTQALADCRGVTARVRWVSKSDVEGYHRWIHCTPLLGSNGAVGVWMIVIVDEEVSQSREKRSRVAPPIDPKYGRSIPFMDTKEQNVKDFGECEEAG
ncbi:Non-phototropic hypocotyl 1B [Hyphodiscus hymeniophilus]|uniref:Non-phototropic hypocotyl 1B n=1 Tax=Hyphodiscus hymeniophilus TaxID=353542 RepID=A0A9P6VFB2_9HELO|nr:Non-phototropic hypocotyl 1B [Hyphodiscus hymeniophilus]